MLQNSSAFSSIAVNDLAAARKFYVEMLGIEVKDNPMGLLELHIKNTEPIIIYPKGNHEPVVFTVLNFPVPNIEAVVDELTAKGVTFEQYSELSTDAKGISRNDYGPAMHGSKTHRAIFCP